MRHLNFKYFFRVKIHEKNCNGRIIISVRSYSRAS